ncbi:MAG: sodium:solute symporter family protein [Myxococcota bacterium]
MTILIVVGAYLVVLLMIGVGSSRLSRGTSQDYFVASRSIGPFLLVMSLFGTTMTAFALIGSTGKAYTHGVGVYGLMASISGLVHAAIFFAIGARVWALGKRHGHLTQVQLFRDRFQSERLGTWLFPVLVALVIPYLLIGLMGAGITMQGVTRAAGIEGGVPPWLTAAVISGVVYAYVFAGGLRAAAWANAFQTVVFIVVCLITFGTLAEALGGAESASAAAKPARLIREGTFEPLHFISYVFIPLSVGMFPHLFQHWLTAKSGKTFKAPVVLHPVLIMIVWVPCVLIGVWATGVLEVPPAKANAVLGIMVAKFTTPWMSGLITAGILAAIMSSLDSQFLCLGTMFTQDIAARRAGGLDDTQSIRTARRFVGAVVLVTWLLSLVATRGIFDLGVWCFSGFAGLFPLIVAALYWRRATAHGAMAGLIAAVLTWGGLFALSFGQPGELVVAGVTPAAWIVLASTSALVIVSLMTEPPSEATLERYFATRGAGK